MILGVPPGSLSARVGSRFGAAPDVRGLARCRDARPIGSSRPTPKPAAKESGPVALMGIGIRFVRRSAHPVTITEATRKLVGTTATGAYTTYLPGCLDRSIMRAALGEWEDRIDLLMDHNPDARLTSSVTALEVYADRKRLSFTVRAKSPGGRDAIRAVQRRPGHREVSPGVYLRRFTWQEPDHPGGPGALVVQEGVLYELSILPAGALGRTGILIL